MALWSLLGYSIKEISWISSCHEFLEEQAAIQVGGSRLSIKTE